MRTFIKIFIAVISISFVIHLIRMSVFNTHLDRPAEITELKESDFNFASTKPIYFRVRNKLYYSADGKVNYDMKPIWKGDVEETFVSPNSRYILIYAGEELTLLDYEGRELFHLTNCTGEYKVHEARKSGRFISKEVQWSEASDFFSDCPG